MINSRSVMPGPRNLRVEPSEVRLHLLLAPRRQLIYVTGNESKFNPPVLPQPLHPAVEAIGRADDAAADRCGLDSSRAPQLLLAV